MPAAVPATAAATPLTEGDLLVALGEPSVRNLGAENVGIAASLPPPGQSPPPALAAPVTSPTLDDMLANIRVAAMAANPLQAIDKPASSGDAAGSAWSAPKPSALAPLPPVQPMNTLADALRVGFSLHERLEQTVFESANPPPVDISDGEQSSEEFGDVIEDLRAATAAPPPACAASPRVMERTEIGFKCYMYLDGFL